MARSLKLQSRLSDLNTDAPAAAETGIGIGVPSKSAEKDIVLFLT